MTSAHTTFPLFPPITPMPPHFTLFHCPCACIGPTLPYLLTPEEFPLPPFPHFRPQFSLMAANFLLFPYPALFV